MTLKTLLATATSPGSSALHAGPEVVSSPGAAPERFPSWDEGQRDMGQRRGGVIFSGLRAMGDDGATLRGPGGTSDDRELAQARSRAPC
ncbi:hypothetical protein [Salipiger bermudensis]|uniref:hypothetical protein n=1 Tax=Salipiger bermudensis TaxID=344736 RepID=UPI001CD5FA57|nr:hypothetical protein [Salipiger bermudensis]MCA0964639.1 hypothetical protein [Salipiger bermudensis]